MKRFILLTILLALTAPHLFGHIDQINFIENKGQWPKNVHFKSDVSGGKIWLENNRISYQFTKYTNAHANFNSDEKPSVKQHVVWAEFINANSSFEIEKKAPSSDYSNYFIGSDQSKWVSNAYAYSDIKYTNLYENTDLRIYEKKGLLKYDFILKSGAENNIQIKYQGQDKISMNKRGEIVIKTTLGQVIEEKPYAYQIINGKVREISCKFILKNNIVSFSLGKYDKNIDLIIDPVLVFASYSGSSADNFGMTATYGSDGSLFAGGTTFNAGYPTTAGAYDDTFAGTPARGITDVVITRYDPSGSNLIYSTYIGGLQAETVHSIVANTDNELYIYGATSSSDFPITTGAYDQTFNGGNFLDFPVNGTTFINGTDIYVAKINATGTSLIGSTFIGGSANDGVNHTVAQNYDTLMNNYGDQYRGEIVIDSLGNCYVASSTKSSDFPVLNGFDNALNGHQDAVVFKFNSTLTSLNWSSYLGGSNADAGFSIKVDPSNFVYVSGGTNSTDFPSTAGSINTTYLGGEADGYITKIDSNGSNILASTLIGTNSYDQCYFIEIDRFNNIYTVGQTRGNFPVINAPYSNPNSGGFIVKMDSNLTTIDYSTIFGNGNVNADFSPTAFLVDRCQNVYVSGWGGSILGGASLTGMPITTNSILSATGDVIPTTSGDGFNFYLTVFERDMKSQLFGIYYGSPNSKEHVDGGTSRFDKNGIIYQSVCAGCGGDQNFPTSTGAHSNDNRSSNCNNGVFKFDFEIIPVAKFTVDNIAGCAPLSVTFTNSSNKTDAYLWDFGGGDTTSQIFNPVKTYSTPGIYNVSLLITDSICNTVDTAFQKITVNPPVNISGGNTRTTCDTTTLAISATGNPTTFIWSSNNQFTDTLNTNLKDSIYFVNATDTAWYYVLASNGPCSAIDSFLINFPSTPNASFTVDTSTGCTPLTVSFTNNSDATDSFLWDFGGGDTTSLIFSPVKTYSTPGTYNVSLIIKNTICDRADTVFQTITVNSSINITSGNTITTCDTARLSVSTTGNPTSFIWSSDNQFTDTLNLNNLNDSSYLANPSDTSWYYVMATNGLCSAIDSFLVNYPGFGVDVERGTICQGNSDTLSVFNRSGQTLSYSWSPVSSIISGANTSTPVVNPQISTNYILTSQNTYGCIDYDTVYVIVSNFNDSNIIITADKDTLIKGQGTFLHVVPQTGFSYSWSPPSLLNNSKSSDPFTTPLTTATYTAELTELTTGCVYRKNYTLFVYEINCDEPDLFLPNAFTPNGDGENDILFVRGKNVEKMTLKIFNRWGETIFESTDQKNGWDGTYKGEFVDPGVFVYYLKITCIDEQEYFKEGNVTVIR